MTVADLILAVRGGPGAKSRCAPMPPAGRQALVEAMLEDMLRTARRATRVRHVYVVTPTEDLAILASGLGARVVREARASGVNAAFALGLAAAAETPPATASILAPADLPLVGASDLDGLVGLYAPGRPAICPARADGGTGAILVGAGEAFRLSFGEDSFRRHLAAARSAGLHPMVAVNERFGLDLDSPGDLPPRFAAQLPPRTAACLRAWGTEVAR